MPETRLIHSTKHHSQDRTRTATFNVYEGTEPEHREDIQVSIELPHGWICFHLSPEAADEIAAHLREASDVAKGLQEGVIVR